MKARYRILGPLFEKAYGSRLGALLLLLAGAGLGYFAIYLPILQARQGVEDVNFYPMAVILVATIMPMALAQLVMGQRFVELISSNRALELSTHERIDHALKSARGETTPGEAAAHLTPLGKVLTVLIVLWALTAVFLVKGYLNSFGYDF